MSAYFITGTDTEIGKTFATCALMVALRARGQRVAPMKPIAAGTTTIGGIELNEDVHALLGVYGEAIDSQLVNPYCFAEPIAPHLAAQHAQRSVSVAVIKDAFEKLAASHDGVLVEGAGGFLVPLDDAASMADIPRALGLDVILVVGMRLGCLNHALLTVEAIRARGLGLAGWIANTVDTKMLCADENFATLRRLIPAPCLGVLPRLPDGETLSRAHQAAARLQIDPLIR